jgi:hypothetical protein
MRTPLCEIALKWRTDKVKDVYHDYTPWYYEKLAGRQVKRVLEIGIGTPGKMPYPGYRRAASLHTWAEFFPEAEIFGLDIDEAAMVKGEDRITTFVCDQGSSAQLRQRATEAGGRFDLIVDDGSHQPVHQLITAWSLLDYLNSGGLYVIEDVYSPRVVAPGLPQAERWHVYECRVELPSRDNRLIYFEGESKSAAEPA